MPGQPVEIGREGVDTVAQQVEGDHRGLSAGLADEK